MSRYSRQTSRNHGCQKLGDDTFIISWIIDYYYSGDRLRYPRGFSKITNSSKATKFCKKHGILFPEDIRCQEA